MKFDMRVKKINIESFVNGSNGIVISLVDGSSILLALLASFGYISVGAMAQSNKLGLGPIRGCSLSEEATSLRQSTLSLITGNKEKRSEEEFLLGY